MVQNERRARSEGAREGCALGRLRRSMPLRDSTTVRILVDASVALSIAIGRVVPTF